MRGKPNALWRVWCVMEYDTMPIWSSCAICSMMAVLPIPGAPMRKTGRCRAGLILYIPASSLSRYASTVSLICSFASAMFMAWILSVGTVSYEWARSALLNRLMPSSSITTRMAHGGTFGRCVSPLSMKTNATSYGGILSG